MKSQLDNVNDGRMTALKIQTNLANQYEIDNNNLLKETKYNIAPVPADDKLTPNEKLQNNTLQIQILRKALREIMVDVEVWKFSTKYVGNDAGFINTHFEEMKKLLKDRKYITADFFRNFVVAFKTNYIATKTVNTQSPSSPTYDPNNILDVGLEARNMTEGAKKKLAEDIENNIRDKQKIPEVENILSNAYISSFPSANQKNIVVKMLVEYNNDPVKIDRTLNAVKNAETLNLDETVFNLYIRNIDRINAMEANNSIKKEDAKRYERIVFQQIQAINDNNLPIASFQEPQPTREVNRNPNAPFVPISNDEIFQFASGNQSALQDYLENRAGNALSREGIERTVSNLPKITTDEKMVNFLRLLIGDIYESDLEKYLMANQPQLTASSMKEFKKQIKKGIKLVKNTKIKPNELSLLLNKFNNERNALMKDIDDETMNTPLGLHGSFINTGNGLYTGNGVRGMQRIQQQYLKSNRVRIGGGISIQDRPLYQHLGRYIIHIPSLTKNVLNVKYPSMVSIKALPKRPISTMFKNLMFEMLDTENFNKKYYNILDEEEQDLVRDVLYQAQIGEKFGFGLKDTPYSTIIDRFNLLKSQVIAGNNNKEVISELKTLTSKLVDKSVLNKGDGFELLNLINAI